MLADPLHPPPRRLLVVLPNWVGDVVMATPTLAALREHFRSAEITYLLRPYVQEIVAGSGWHNTVATWPTGGRWQRSTGLLTLAGQLRRQRFDLAILMPNSLRAALVAWLADIPRRVGYVREGRGPLLTDRLTPLRLGGVFVPVPILPYYAALAERVGCPVSDRRMRLGVTDEQEAAATRLREHYALRPGRYAVINPGAAFGAAKCWLPERFAAVCDQLDADLGLKPALVGAPGEVELMRRIADAAERRPTVIADPGTTLGSLKAIIRDAAVLVCNDTGPRHYGVAFGVPTVTIFGPTYQEWTDIEDADEIKLQAEVPCGPCQLKRCPLDLACQKKVTVEMVMRAVHDMLERRGRQHVAAASVQM